MANKNAVLYSKEQMDDDITESFDFDALEEKLQSQLKEELADMQFLAEEKEKIGSPDNLGNVVMDVVWEQFLNQVAVTAGEDFIKENRGLTLDLRKEAHIQTTENFAKGKMATHNTEIDYQQRYDGWQSNFVKDKNGNVVTHQTRSGKEEATLAKGARKPFDDGRPKGSAEKHTDMDHTISAAEIIRDPAANAHMTKDEQIAFANSDANLYEMDSSLNRSKGDKSTTEWLDNPNSNGQKPDKIFELSDEDVARLRHQDEKAREEYEKRKKEAEQRSIEAGEKSRKEEAFRIGGKALRAVLMQLLAELVREIIAKLVQWFKSSKKALDTLLDSFKEAIHSFVSKLKQHLINAGNTLFTTIATAIYGSIVSTVKKAWMMLTQAWSFLGEAMSYIQAPANKGKPIGILLMEVGKIVVAGMTGISAMLLGDAIEKGLMAISIFVVEIPLLGSLASVLGVFFGAVVMGIIGAIAINLIEKLIEKRLKRENVNAQIEQGNKMLSTQYQLQAVNAAKIAYAKSVAGQNIRERHVAAADMMAESVENIQKNCAIDEGVDDAFNDIDMLFEKLVD